MHKFNLSSSQKMLLFSEVNSPNNDSFYLKFRKDYDLKDFDDVKQSIERISRTHLNLKIKYINYNTLLLFFILIYSYI